MQFLGQAPERWFQAGTGGPEGLGIAPTAASPPNVTALAPDDPVLRIRQLQRLEREQLGALEGHDADVLGDGRWG
jgi:hypothetical protein